MPMKTGRLKCDRSRSRKSRLFYPGIEALWSVRISWCSWRAFSMTDCYKYFNRAPKLSISIDGWRYTCYSKQQTYSRLPVEQGKVICQEIVRKWRQLVEEGKEDWVEHMNRHKNQSNIIGGIIWKKDYCAVSLRVKNIMLCGSLFVHTLSNNTFKAGKVSRLFNRCNSGRDKRITHRNKRFADG